MTQRFVDFSFEINDGNWGAFGGGVVTQTATQRYIGTKSAQVVANADFDGIYCNTTAGWGSAAGSPIVASGRIKSPAGTELELYIQRVNLDASSDNVMIAEFVGDGAWKYFSVASTVAVGKTLDRANLLIIHNPGYVGNITFFVDPVYIEDAASPSSLPGQSSRTRSQFELRPY